MPRTRLLLTTFSIACLPFAALAQTTQTDLVPLTAADHTPVTHAELPGLISQYLLDHPEIVMQAAQKYQMKAAEDQMKQSNAALKQHKSELATDTSSPIAGNPHGNVTIVEFFDYHCGYCKHLMPDMVKLIGEDKNLRVVFREFPILAEDSATAARAALAVYRIAPDKYFAYHQALMKSNGKFDEAMLLDTAKKLGIDPVKLKAEMDRKDIADMLDRNRALAHELGIEGTPALVIGDTLFPGALPYDDMKKAIADARQGPKPTGKADAPPQATP